MSTTPAIGRSTNQRPTSSDTAGASTASGTSGARVPVLPFLPKPGAPTKDLVIRQLQNKVDLLTKELEIKETLNDELMESVEKSDEALRAYKASSRAEVARVEAAARDDVAAARRELNATVKAKNEEIKRLQEKAKRLTAAVEELQGDVVAGKQRELTVQEDVDRLKRELEASKVRTEAWVEQAAADRSALLGGGRAAGRPASTPSSDVAGGDAVASWAASGDVGADVTARAMHSRTQAAIRNAKNEAVYLRAQWEEERRCREEAEEQLHAAQTEVADLQAARRQDVEQLDAMRAELREESHSAVTAAQDAARSAAATVVELQGEVVLLQAQLKDEALHLAAARQRVQELTLEVESHKLGEVTLKDAVEIASQETKAVRTAAREAADRHAAELEAARAAVETVMTNSDAKAAELRARITRLEQQLKDSEEALQARELQAMTERSEEQRMVVMHRLLKTVAHWTKHKEQQAFATWLAATRSNREADNIRAAVEAATTQLHATMTQDHEASTQALQRRMQDAHDTQQAQLQAMYEARLREVQDMSVEDKSCAVRAVRLAANRLLQSTVTELQTEADARLVAAESRHAQELQRVETQLRSELQAAEEGRAALVSGFMEETEATRVAHLVDKEQAVAAAVAEIEAKADAELDAVVHSLTLKQEDTVAKLIATKDKERAVAVTEAREDAELHAEEEQAALQRERIAEVTQLQAAIDAVTKQRDEARHIAGQLQKTLRQTQRGAVVLRLQSVRLVLKMQSERIRHDQELQQQHTHQQSLHNVISGLEDKMEALRRSLGDTKVRLQALETLRVDMLDAIRLHKRDDYLAHKQHADTIMVHLDEAQAEVDRLTEDRDTKMASIDHIEQKIKEVEAQLYDASQKSAVRADGELDRHVTRLKKRLNKEYDTLVDRVAGLRSDVSVVKTRLKGAVQVRQARQTDLDSVEAEMTGVLEEKLGHLLAVVRAVPPPPPDFVRSGLVVLPPEHTPALDDDNHNHDGTDADVAGAKPEPRAGAGGGAGGGGLSLLAAVKLSTDTGESP